MEYDKLTKAQQKKLASIEKRMKKCNEEIQAMGFNVYLACSTINIVAGDTHDKYQVPIKECVRHSFILKGWDGGDW